MPLHGEDDGKNVDARTKLRRTLSIVIFAAGAVLGLTLAGLSVWADIEAMYYGFDTIGDVTLPTLRCPVLMTRHETGRIHATFTGADDRSIQFLVRADISGPALLRSERSMLSLAPHEKQRVEWAVTADDIDLGFFILAKVGNYPAYQLPFREATCGIVVLGLPLLTGNQLFVLAAIGAALSLVAGLLGWQANNRPLLGRSLDVAAAMRFALAVVLSGLLFSVLGWWLATAFAVLVGLLLMVALLRFAAGD